MEGNDDGLQGFSIRMGTTGRRDNTLKSTLDCLAQAIERLSLKIDNRSLAEDTYRSGHDRQSNQPPPYQPLSHRPPHHPSPRYSLQHPRFKFFYEKDLHNPIYPYNEFKDDYEDEELVIRPPPFMTSYQSNEIRKQHQ